jgi:hypothetical protein
MKHTGRNFKKNSNAVRELNASGIRVWKLNGKEYLSQRDLLRDNYIGKSSEVLDEKPVA